MIEIRPFGLDPKEVYELPCDGLGTVKLGYVPRGKLTALLAHGIKHAIDSRRIADDETIENAEKIHQLIHQRAQVEEVNREIVRWGVRGWASNTLPAPVLEEEEFSLGQIARKLPVLSRQSLDVLDAYGFITMLAHMVNEFWSLTEQEKKPSKTLTSGASTSPATDATDSRISENATDASASCQRERA